VKKGAKITRVGESNTERTSVSTLKHRKKGRDPEESPCRLTITNGARRRAHADQTASYPA